MGAPWNMKPPLPRPWLELAISLHLAWQAGTQPNDPNKELFVWENPGTIPEKNGGLGKPSINGWVFIAMCDYCRVSQAWIHTEGISQRVFNPQSTYTTIGPTIIMTDLASDILWRQLIYGNRDRVGSFMVHWPVRLRLAKIFEFEPAIPIVTQKRIEKDWNWSLLSEDWPFSSF